MRYPKSKINDSLVGKSLGSVSHAGEPPTPSERWEVAGPVITAVTKVRGDVSTVTVGTEGVEYGIAVGGWIEAT